MRIECCGSDYQRDFGVLFRGTVESIRRVNQGKKELQSSQWLPSPTILTRPVLS